MFDPSSNAPAKISIQPSIFLDYGMAGAAGEDLPCEVCERGMRFKSPWQFAVGAILSVAFSFDEGATPMRVEAEGMVIECAPNGNGRHLTTLAFLETPAELRESLGKVSARLISSHASPQAAVDGACD